MTKHDDFCPCTRFRAQEEFCTCGAVGRDEIVNDVSKAFGDRLSEIMHEHRYETHGPSGMRICACGQVERKSKEVSQDLLGDLIDVLHECEGYFDRRADADCDQDGFIPNEEMKLLSEVREAIAKATA